MRFAPLLALTLIAACGDVTAGASCSLTRRCGGDLVCDMTDPDGAKCVDPDADDDGDGLPNKRDFCQHMAGGQFDEDLDQIGDDCDKCPIAPPPATPDTDGDDVDSPCDPDPTTPGDKIVVFDGFNGSAIPTNWKPSTAAAWVISGGQAIVTPAQPQTYETLTAPLPLVSNHVAILAGYRIDRVDTTATENAAGVFGIDVRPAGQDIVFCSGSRIGGMDHLTLDTGISGSQDTVDDLFNPAGLYRVALELDGATARCALIGDHDTGAAQAMSRGENATSAAIGAKGATVRFSYLLAVQRSIVTPP